MSERSVRISEAESRIMDALWTQGALGVAHLLEEVAEAQNWTDATVKALIGRLLKKGAIRSRRVEGRVVYEPLVSRESYVRAESQEFMDRLFGGELSPLVAHFAKDRNLTPDEMQTLSALLAKIDGDE